MDGSLSEEGSLLVGVDGSGSIVAEKLAGEHLKPIDLGSRMIFGKSPLTPTLEKAVHPEFLKGICVGVDTSRAKTEKARNGKPAITNVFVETCRFTHPGAPQDYTFWILTDTAGFQRQVPNDSELLSATSEQAAAIAERSTAHLEPSIRAIFEHQDEGVSGIWASRCTNPSEPLQWPNTYRVTILGDAAHSVPPAGGLGANACLNSCTTLVSALVRGNCKMDARGDEASKKGQRTDGPDDDGWDNEVVATWENQMREEAAMQVKLAFAATTGSFPMSAWKPIVDDL